MRTSGNRTVTALLAVGLAAGVALAADDAVPQVEPAWCLVDGQTPGLAECAVWVHPESPLLSLLLATDDQGQQLASFSITGARRETLAPGLPGGLAVIYGFPLGGTPTDLVMVNEWRQPGQLRLYRVDVASRALQRVDNDGIVSATGNRIACYHSRKTGQTYAIVSGEQHNIVQYQLVADGAGRITALAPPAASREVGGGAGALCVDDETAKLYVVERLGGVWEFGAEPDDDTPGRVVIPVNDTTLKPEVGGLALFPVRPDVAYLLVASRADDTVGVYARGTFKLVGRFGIAGATRLGGLAACGAALGSKYPQGVVWCTAETAVGRRALLGLPWESIAAACQLPVANRATWDPRANAGAASDQPAPDKPDQPEKPDPPKAKPKLKPPVVR